MWFIRVPKAEVEDTLKRIETHKGVIGTIVVNAEGKSHGDADEASQLHLCAADLAASCLQVFPSELLWITPPLCSTQDFSAASPWRRGAPSGISTLRMTSPSSVCAPKNTRSWLHLVSLWLLHNGGLIMTNKDLKEELSALLTFVLLCELTGSTPLSLLQRMTSCWSSSRTHVNSCREVQWESAVGPQQSFFICSRGPLTAA